MSTEILKNSIIFLDTSRSVNTRTSGHAYSAEAVWKALKKSSTSIFLHCTDISDHSINCNSNEKDFLIFPRKSYIFYFRTMQSIIKRNNIDYILTYDITQYEFLLRFLSFFLKIPLIHCKPGGPYQKKWAYCRNLIVFTEEDRENFKSTRNISVIPNRITFTVPEVHDRLKQDICVFQDGRFLFLRISRLSAAYEKLFFKSIDLIRYLKSNDFKVCALFVGYPQDFDVKNRIEACIRANKLEKTIRLETDDEFTDHASKLLPLADAVIGAGRGAMEACITGKPLLIYIDDIDSVAVFNDKTSAAAIRYNFSMRTRIEVAEKYNFYNDIQHLLCSKQKQCELSDYAQYVGKTLFDASDAPTKINAFVKTAYRYNIFHCFRPALAVGKEQLARHFGRTKLGLR